jgi:hypothetical protein
LPTRCPRAGDAHQQQHQDRRLFADGGDGAGARRSASRSITTCCSPTVGLGAAAYSPAKYGILTEYLPHDKLVIANGWIEGLTVAAIILGTWSGRRADQSDGERHPQPRPAGSTPASTRRRK